MVKFQDFLLSIALLILAGSLGVAATGPGNMEPRFQDCAECLTKPSTTPSTKSTCCTGLATNVEYFHWGASLSRDDTCVTGTGSNSCYKQGSAPCCGKKMGFNYAATKAGDFREGCDKITQEPGGNALYTCGLWKLVTEFCSSRPRCSAFASGLAYTLTLGGWDDAHLRTRWMVLPGTQLTKWAVRGIEDPKIVDAITAKKSDYESIINAAWNAAFRPKSALGATEYEKMLESLKNRTSNKILGQLPVSEYTANIGIGLNPTTTRSMHQMHIHIALVPKPLRKLLTGRTASYGKWTKVFIPISKRNKEMPRAYVKYFSFSNAETGNIAKVGVFEQVFKLSGFDLTHWRMGAWGFVLIPDEDPQMRTDPPNLPKGVYVVASVADGLGVWNPWPNNPYSTKQAYVQGQYTPFLPEWLLCSSESLSAGNDMWTQAECPYWNSKPLSTSLEAPPPVTDNYTNPYDDDISSDWLF